MPKECQKKDTIDAKTHPKSMPKYESTNIKKIIIIQLLLNGKFIQIQCKNNGVLRFNSLRARTEMHQKTDQK